MSAPTPEEMFARSVERFGIDHTHDVTCRTWRSHNGAGACDCTLDERWATKQVRDA